MATPDAARRRLYTRLTDVIGAEQADTLMSYLPPFDPGELATKAGLAALEDRLERVEHRLDGLESRMDAGLAAVNQRLDRLFLTLLTAAFGTLTAVAAAFLAGTLL